MVIHVDKSACLQSGGFYEFSLPSTLPPGF